MGLIHELAHIYSPTGEGHGPIWRRTYVKLVRNVIGDKEADVELGRAIGAATFLVRTGHGEKYAAASKADHVVADLPAAVDIILGDEA